MSTIDYAEFLDRKSQLVSQSGFEPIWMPDWLFGFQSALVEWAIRKGRCALFEDCGLGKTPQQLVWAENVVRHTNGKVLIVTPLSVSFQTVREAEKFGIEAAVSRDGKPAKDITVTNYERLHYFDPGDFAGVVCDESSAIKDFAGARRKLVTEFMRKMAYRLLCTATAAPNDFIELGTSSEALGELGHMDMLGRFFKNDDKTLHLLGQKYGDLTQKGWRFKRHAERAFWKWVCSWARACRRPSDLGFDDGQFLLPELVTTEHTVTPERAADGCLFDRGAVTLQEQQEEQRRTVPERCERVAELLEHSPSAVAWCHLNPEGDLLEKLIPGAVQIAGKDSDERKEEVLAAFSAGQISKLVTKPTICGWGLNWQHCAHQSFFPSHSFEQWYQAVRRSYRFGQTKPVVIDVVTTESAQGILGNLRRKAEAAERMFAELVALMNEPNRIQRTGYGSLSVEVPTWL